MKYRLLYITLLFFFGSCHSQKTMVQAKDSSTVVLQHSPTHQQKSTPNQVKPQELEWEYFSGKYEIDFQMDGDDEYNGTMNFRMRRDSIIWFSITASIGFQVAKGIITKDSFHGLDLLGKNYYRYSLENFKKTTGLPANVGVIQRLFTGELLTVGAMYNPSDSCWTDTAFFKGYSGKSDGNFNLIENKIVDDNPKSKNQLWFNYISRLGDGAKEKQVASESNITLNALNTIRLKLQLKTSTFEFIPSYPFNVPKGYKIME